MPPVSGTAPLRCLTQGFLCQEKTVPLPSPGHGAHPCRAECSLIYEGQAGTGPSGRQQEIGTEEHADGWRKQPPRSLVPASRKLAEEGGEGCPSQGQT